MNYAKKGKKSWWMRNTKGRRTREKRRKMLRKGEIEICVLVLLEIDGSNGSSSREGATAISCSIQRPVRIQIRLEEFANEKH